MTLARIMNRDDWYNRLTDEDYRRVLALLRERPDRDRQHEISVEIEAIVVRYGIEGLDGINEPATIALRDKFQATGFDLNTGWAWTPTDWQCPCCKRRKPEIVRVTKSRRLWGHLHSHHDHFRDGFDELAEQRSIELGIVSPANAARDFLFRFVDGLQRFDDILICGDCNIADGEAKTLVGAPKSLTFTPSEIASIIVINANQPHSLDGNRASSVFANALPLYELRRKSAVALVDRTLRGDGWYEHIEFEHRSQSIERRARDVAGMRGLRNFSLLIEPAAKAKASDRWRRTRHELATVAPTDTDIAFMAEKDHCTWKAFAPNWSCASCQRSKRQAISRTHGGAWQFKAASDMKLAGKKHSICHDCIQTDKDFRKETSLRHGMRDAADVAIAIDELRSIIQPQPNTKHNINNDVVLQLMASFTQLDPGEYE
jgi:hypothetical protein